MNITIIIGWVVSFGLVTFGIFNGGQLDWFIDVPSLAITVGGTIGCLFASFPLSYLKNLPKYLKLALFPKKFNPQSYIEQIVEFAKIARTKGLISLEDSANKCEDPFLKESLMLIVDANDLDKVKSMLDDATDFMCERHERGRLFFEKGMSVFPAFGMLGTLVGLVNMLKGMGADSSNLSSGMAVGFSTALLLDLHQSGILQLPQGIDRFLSPTVEQLHHLVDGIVEVNPPVFVRPAIFPG